MIASVLNIFQEKKKKVEEWKVKKRFGVLTYTASPESLRGVPNLPGRALPSSWGCLGRAEEPLTLSKETQAESALQSAV